MAYTPRPNTGSLFANKVKKHPKSPDYSGDLLIDVSTLEVNGGVATVKLAGWKKTSSTGSTFLSISIDTFKPDPNRARPMKSNADSAADLDDDVPF